MANTNGAEAEVIKKSVTAGDYNANPFQGIYHFMLPAGPTAPDLPAFWSLNRDYVLHSTLYRESMWAAAIALAITKSVAESFEVKSDIPLRAKNAQQLFLSMDTGRGWVGGLGKHLQAYLLTGNGGAVEIVRATGAPGSKILGLVPLDTFRTVRTGDPEIPLLYRDRLGRLHEMKTHEVFILSEMPDQSDLWYGVGHCAAERAYRAIVKLEAIERYITDKVSGQRALALDFINGVMPEQITDAKKAAQAEAVARGVVNYLGSVLIALMGDTPPQHVRIPLAELPDGFNRKEEFDIAILTYARSIGIPVQDLQPLSGQGLGTGAQTVVLDEAAKGQGRAAWRKDWAHAVNEHVLDDKTTFVFSERDIRDREREAKIRIDEAAAIEKWVTMGAINASQAAQLGADRDQLPKEFVPQDVTPEESLSDTEKPETESEEAQNPITAPEPEPVLSLPPAPVVEKESIVIMMEPKRDNEREMELFSRIADQGDALRAILKNMSNGQSSIREKSEANARALKDALAGLGETVRRLKSLDGRVGKLQASNEEKNRAGRAVLGALKQSLNALKAMPDDDRKLLTEISREVAQVVNEKSAQDIQAVADKAAQSATRSIPGIALEAAQSVADRTAAAVTAGMAGQQVTRSEVIEKDDKGRPVLVRRTTADGHSSDYRVVRDDKGAVKEMIEKV